MQPIKLSSLTKPSLEQRQVQPIDIVSHTIQLLNDSYPKVELVGGSCKWPHGRVVQTMEPHLFNEWCRSEEQFNLEKKNWIKVEDQFYDVEEIVIKFMGAGIKIEDDLKNE